MPAISKLERKLEEGREARERLLQNLNEVIELIRSCKKSLQELKKDIKDFHETCNVSKTVGTTVGVAGAACATVGIVGAIFTGGTSLVLTASALGTAYGLTGAAINVTTSIVDLIKSKGYLEDINAWLRRIQRKERDLKSAQDEFNRTIEFVMDSFSLEGDVATSITNQFYSMGKNFKSGVEKLSSILVFMLGLAFVKPCSADPTVVLNQFANAFGPVLAQGVRYVPPEVIRAGAGEIGKNVAKEAARQAGVQAMKSGVSIGEAAVAAEANAAKQLVQVSSKTALSTSGKLLQGSLAALNIGLAIYDVVNVVNSWKSTHPAVTAVESTVETLTALEVQVQAQVDALVEVLTDVANDDVHSDDETSSSSSSSDDEDDRIRIYDISPQTLTSLLTNWNLWTGKSCDNDPIRALEKLLNKINTAQFGPSSYFELIQVLQDLMDNHGAKFCRNRGTGNVSTIHLDVGGTVFDFDESKRVYLSLLLTPIHNVLYKKRLQPPLNFCCIYRFHCIKCNFSSFSYVGQAQKFRSRYRQHSMRFITDWMDREDRLLAGDQIRVRPASVLYEHFYCHHADESLPCDVFEVDVVHRLPDHSSRGRHDSEVRRSWEIFYQWLFRALVEEGGRSRR